MLKSMTISNRIVSTLAVASALFSSVSLFAQNADEEIIMTNPLNLKYLFEESGAVHRTCADPVIVLYHDKYFLFSSHASGYSYSDNLRDWTHMFSNMPLVKEWAPAVMVYNDYIYYMAFGDKKVYRTNDPINDKWEQVTWSELADKGDPDYFIDDDGKTYYLWGCSAGGAMQGQEFDPETFKPLTAVKDLMPANGKRLGWEVPGDMNEKTSDTGWNEGVSMVHEGDYYYFFYATPGTEYTSYCTGAYVGKSPLGPFQPMKGSPFAIKPAGFLTGGGHGHPFKDRYGNHWYVASLIIGAREHYERRIGIFPAFYNNGYAHAITDNFDHPFVVPNRKVDFEKESILLDVNLLSSGKTMTASSSFNDMTPDKAADDYVRSWWSAKTGSRDEWLQMDLGHPMTVSAIQVCFADEGFTSRRYDNNIPIYKYIVEGSNDGNTWRTLVDRSKNTQDQICELLTINNEQVRFIRVVNKVKFASGKFSVTELRVFGKDDAPKLGSVGNFAAARGEDSRRIQITWDPVDKAEGYIIRWGATEDRMDHASRVYTNYFDYGFFDTQSDYYLSVQPFSEAGLGENSPVVKVEAKPNIISYTFDDGGDGNWYQQTYVTVKEGSGFKLGPQADRTGQWNWSGPNNYTAKDREIHVTGVNASKAGVYTLNFKGSDGKEAILNVLVNVEANGAPTITPSVNVGAGWQKTSMLSVIAGGSFSIAPLPNNGSWKWSGPNGFTSDKRQIDFDKATSAQSGVYTATYTSSDGKTASHLFYVNVKGSVAEYKALSTDALTPYIYDQYGWHNISNINLIIGDDFTLSPAAATDGSWSWSGPNGFSANTREVSFTDASLAHSGTYTAKFTSAGATLTQDFKVVVTEKSAPLAIRSIKSLKSDEAIYNLLGQKVDKPTQRGIYIVGGQKVIIDK